MRTKVINASDVNAYASQLADAARALRAGEIVLFPTETVYGIGAHAFRSDAVAKLRQLKERAPEQPFTVHLGQPRHARQYLTDPPPVFRRLARKGWPGPLTLICHEPHPEQTEVGQRFGTENLGQVYQEGRVGLRCPDHPEATRLLTEAEVPVVASSANRHGAPPPLEFAAALEGYAGQVAYAIDAGRTRYSAASTVVEVRGHDWQVVRPGAMDARTLQRYARSEIMFVCTGNSCRSPMAEYMLRRMLAQRLGLSEAELTAAGYVVSSAGTLGLDGSPASSGSLEEMARRGIDLASHRARPLTVERIHQAERVFALSPEHRQAVLELVPAAGSRVELLDGGGPIADPIGGTAETYARCADEIERALEIRLEEFLHEDRDW